MLWKKRKANEQSVLGIVALATPFAYKVHDVIMENDKETGYFKDNGEQLFKCVMAAGAMIAIVQLDDDYYSLYFESITEKLESHYSNVGHLCLDFNEFIRANYHPNVALNSVVLKWLHVTVGTGDVSNKVELELLTGAVKAIFEVYYDWFSKNGMSIK